MRKFLPLLLLLNGCAFSHIEGPCTIKTETVCGEGSSKTDVQLPVPVPIIRR